MGGDIGVALTACITLTGSLQYGIRQSAEAENLMTSVERVMDYGELESEADLTSPKESTPFSDGVIQFKNVWLKYSENSKPVLKDISFKSTKHEKIGIVGNCHQNFPNTFSISIILHYLSLGRTGAGKSSLITALFRLTEPSSGTIWIDSQNVCQMGLHDLRKQISLIPQEPFLFTTSLRRNLDPFDKFPDSDIWSAINQVCCKCKLLGQMNNAQI